MADPAAAGAVPPGAATPSTSRLLGHAVAMALDHAAAPQGAADRWRFGPLVIVSPAEDAASAAVIGAAGLRVPPPAAHAIAMRSGRSFDREIAAALAADRLDRLAARLAASRLVVVDRIDRVGGGQRHRAVAHLLDHVSAAGSIWVVSTATHPATGAGTHVESRLCGGLVVLPPTASPSLALPWQATRGATPSLARIIRVAARLHDVEPAVVTGASRSRTVAAARSLAMYLARRLTGRSLQAIGAACGGRDHSTVLHAVRVCAARIAGDPAFSAEVDLLATTLGARITGGEAPVEARPPGVGCATLARGLRGRRRPRRRLA